MEDIGIKRSEIMQMPWGITSEELERFLFGLRMVCRLQAMAAGGAVDEDVEWLLRVGSWR